MAQGKQLADQLGELFSDVAPPEPQASHELAPDTTTDDAFVASIQMSPSETPSREPAVTDPSDEPSPTTLQTELGDGRPSEPHHLHKKGRTRITRRSFTVPTRWQSKLGRKLILAFLGAALVPSLIIATFGVITQVSRVRSTAISNLELLATLQENQVEHWVQAQSSTFTALAHEPNLVRQVRAYLTNRHSESNEQAIRLSINAHLSSFQVQHPTFDEVFLLNADGQVIFTSDPGHQDDLEADAPYFTRGREGNYYGPARFFERLDKLSMVAAEPITHISGELIAVLVGLYKPEPLGQLMQESPGLGGTGEIYLVNEERRLVTSLGEDEAPAPGDWVRSLGIEQAVAGASGQSTYSNYAGLPVVGVYRWLPQLQMGLLAEREVTDAYGSIFVTAGGTLVVAVIAIVLTAFLAGQMAQRIAQPVVQITQAARQMVSGDLDQSVVIDRNDELGELGNAFNHMAGRLRMTIAGLEEQVTKRTAELQRATNQYRRRSIHLEASAEISRAAASILEPDKLMQTTVDLIRDRFKLYHVSLFLLGEARQWAVVRGSTGDVGRQMVARPHRLAVNGNSMVGWVCAHGQSRIALDVGTDAVHFDNPLLPDTRSELVLPLLVGDRLLGALDVQSSQEAAFDVDDVRSLQSMADLVAVALQNAHLFAETRRSAEHQQFVARVTDRLQRASSIDDLLTQTLEELAETFDLAQAVVCLGTAPELRAAENGHEQEASVAETQSALRPTATRRAQTHNTE